MAQAKVTNYYTRRKRIDDGLPTKRRKLLRSVTEDEAAFSPPVHAVTKQLVPQIDQAIVLENTASLTSTKPERSATRSKSVIKNKAKTRASRSTKNTKTGPLDKHLQKVDLHDQNFSTCLQTVDLQLPKTSGLDLAETSQTTRFTTRTSPPSTPTKRPQHSDDAPSQKKRSRITSEENGFCEGGVLGVQASEANVLTGTTRKKVHAGRQLPKERSRGRSAKKSLEASLRMVATNDECDGKDNIKNKNISASELESSDSSPSTPPMLLSKSPSSSNTTQDTSESPVSVNKGKLQAFIERSTQSVAAVSSHRSNVIGSTLGKRIRETVQNTQATLLKTVDGNSSGDNKLTKLTPTEMKERLSKSYKLSDLQARLTKVKECAEQAKKTKRAEKVSASSEKATAASPVKTEEPPMPAYLKHHALASSAPPSLSLPSKYKLLEEMFRGTDTVVSMLHNRSETCSFSKLKQAVQEMCRRTFETHNLGQIKTVYPTAYSMSQQKARRSGLKEKSTNGFELVVEPNIGSGVGMSSVKETSEATKQPSKGSVGNAMDKLIHKLTPSMLIARRSIFHNSLVDIVKEHHNEFLSKLDRPLSVPSGKLMRWHPKFPLDQIPEVQPAVLPQPPTVTTYNTAKDVLDKARVMINPRVAKALEVVAKNSALLKAEKDKRNAEENANIKQEPKANQNAKAIGGVSQSLLERIRAKEAQNLAFTMTRSPADEERIAMLERLPELCRILRVFFVSEKKAAIPIESAIQKLMDSYHSALSKAQVEKHVHLMLEVLPEWLSKVVVRKENYLKMNKTKDMSQVNEKVNQLLKESKQVKGQSWGQR